GGAAADRILLVLGLAALVLGELILAELLLLEILLALALALTVALAAPLLRLLLLSPGRLAPPAPLLRALLPRPPPLLLAPLSLQPPALGARQLPVLLHRLAADPLLAAPPGLAAEGRQRVDGGEQPLLELAVHVLRQARLVDPHRDLLGDRAALAGAQPQGEAVRAVLLDQGAVDDTV